MLEYNGADPNNPVDVTAANTGNSTNQQQWFGQYHRPDGPDSWGQYRFHPDSGPGSGFTSSLLTSPDGDIAEDQMVTGRQPWRHRAALLCRVLDHANGSVPHPRLPGAGVPIVRL
jgi:hypothetical protein